MERPQSHIIRDEAQKIFESAISSDHAIRDQQTNDYGIDYEIELFHRDEVTQKNLSTGLVYKIQVKGTETPNWLSDKTRISFPFEIERGEYLIEQIQIPTAIVLVDTIARLVFWVDVHANRELINSYREAKAAKHNTFTIHFEVANKLPDTWTSLITALYEGLDAIALRRSGKVSQPRYEDYLDEIPDVDAEIVHLNHKIDISNAVKLQRLIDTFDLANADKLVQQIMSSHERSVEAKFDAILRTEQIFARSKDSISGFEKAHFDLWQASELDELCRNRSTDDSLKFLARGYTLTAQLNLFAVQDLHLYLNWKQHILAFEQNPESAQPFWLSQLPVERANNLGKLLDIFEQMGDYISQLLESKYWQYLPEFLTRLIWSNTIFLMRLHEEGLEDILDIFEKRLDGIVDFTLELLPKLTSEPQVDNVISRCVGGCTLSCVNGKPQGYKSA